MAHYGTLRDFEFANKSEDVRGANVFGADGQKVGEIEDVILEHSSGEARYVIVDAGGWLTSKRFLIPADQIHSGVEGDFRVSLARAHIEGLPPYDEKYLASEANWQGYEQRYRESWMAAPVQHRAGSDRNVTPAPGEMPIEGGPAPDLAGRDLTPQRLAGKFPGVAPGAEKVRMRPGGTIADAEDASRPPSYASPRWASFESSLRRNRGKIVERCRMCGPGDQTRDAA